MSAIKVIKPWRHRHPQRGMQVLPPGEYRVPTQLPTELAERAIADGVAVMRETKQEIIEQPAPRRGWPKGRRRKLRAPENRALAGAPENKS